MLIFLRKFKTKLFLGAAGLTIMLAISGCQSTAYTLYDEIGGEAKIAEITDNFIQEISFNVRLVPYFKHSNIDRFRDKLNEHLCMLTHGPCKYTGDNMVAVHKGMDINEADFNVLVELLIDAMTKAKLPHTTQNKILAKLAPMRKDIVYK